MLCHCNESGKKIITIYINTKNMIFHVPYKTMIITTFLVVKGINSNTRLELLCLQNFIVCVTAMNLPQ